MIRALALQLPARGKDGEGPASLDKRFTRSVASVAGLIVPGGCLPRAWMNHMSSNGPPAHPPWMYTPSAVSDQAPLWWCRELGASPLGLRRYQMVACGCDIID